MRDHPTREKRRRKKATSCLPFVGLFNSKSLSNNIKKRKELVRILSSPLSLFSFANVTSSAKKKKKDKRRKANLIIALLLNLEGPRSWLSCPCPCPCPCLKGRRGGKWGGREEGGRGINLFIYFEVEGRGERREKFIKSISC